MNSTSWMVISMRSRSPLPSSVSGGGGGGGGGAGPKATEITSLSYLRHLHHIHVHGNKAAMKEHLTSNQKVLGSIPSWSPIFFGVSLLYHILLSLMICICICPAAHWPHACHTQVM